MNRKTTKILEMNGISPSSVRKLSDDAGRMKDVFHIKSSEERDYGVYIYRQPEAGERGRSIEDRIAAEKYIFSKVRDETSLRAPKVLNSGSDFVLCTWLDGGVVGSWEQSEDQVSESERKDVAFKMGEALSGIHSIRYEKFGEFGDNGISDDFDSWQEFVSRIIEMMAESSDKPVISEALNFLEENIDMMDYSASPVLVHGDFHDGNVLQGKKLGIVDCEAGFAGAREYEIDRCSFHWAEDWNTSEEFLNGYGRENLNQGWKERRDYYRILQSTRGMIDGLRLGSSHLVNINEEELKEKLQKVS